MLGWSAGSGGNYLENGEIVIPKARVSYNALLKCIEVDNRVAKKTAGERLFPTGVAAKTKAPPPKDNGIHGAPDGAASIATHGRRLRIKPTRLPSRMLAGRTMQARLRPASAPPAVTPQAPQQPRPRRITLHARIGWAAYRGMHRPPQHGKDERIRKLLRRGVEPASPSTR